MAGIPSVPCCESCGRDLTRHEAVRGPVCSAPGCRRQHEIRRDAARARRAARERRSHAQAFAIRRLGIPGAEFTLAVVPSNDREVKPLPEDRRRRVRGILARAIREAFAPGGPADAPAPAEGRRNPDGQRLLEKGCATCRGRCCFTGGDSAWLTAGTIRRVRRDRPRIRRREILRRYVSHLPARAFPASCVYHAETGCSLPRDLRADICNEYACRDLEALLEARSRLGLRPIALVATDGSVPRRVTPA